MIDDALTEEKCQYLCAMLTEVEEAVFTIPMDSSPRPDGFGSSFLMKCWDIIKKEVIEATQDFFGGELAWFYTSSYIVLIRKVEKPIGFDKFKPISLCFVVYNIFSKILVSDGCLTF